MAPPAGKEKQGAPPAGIWVLIMVIFFTELFFYAWCRVQHVRVGYEISVIRAENQRLQHLRRNLTIEMARLKSPERIAAIATGQLGLVEPAPDQRVTIP
jgi:cell division protein FtsL